MRLLAVLLMLLASGTATGADPGPGPGPQDARFATFVDSMLDRYWQQNPEDALWNGYYKYAELVSVPDATARAESLKFAKDTLSALAEFDPKQLSTANRIDLKMLRNKVEAD